MRYFILLIFLTMLWTCRHEPLSSNKGPLDCDSQLQLVEIKDTCLELPPIGWPICDSTLKILNLRAEFNPANQYEIIFQKQIFGSYPPHSRLIKIHLCSGEQFILSEDTIPGLTDRPRWHPNGWILLGASQLYKIRANGDSLIRLTSIGGRFNPSWIGKDTIVCWVTATGTVLYDKNGGALDTLFSHGVSAGTLRGNRFAGGGFVNGQVSIGYYTLPNWEFTPLYNDIVVSCDWLDDNHIIWHNEHGIFKVNINTGEKTAIKTTCENVYIQSFAVNPENPDRLLLSRSEKKVFGTDSIYCTGGISIFDIPSGREWSIVFPE